MKSFRKLVLHIRNTNEFFASFTGNNLLLSINKTKKLIVDFKSKEGSVTLYFV